MSRDPELGILNWACWNLLMSGRASSHRNGELNVQEASESFVYIYIYVYVYIYI